MISLPDCDVIFLSYDEPNADAHFAQVAAAIPRAQRVHGVQGFDAAHRRAGALATTPFVVTIDADNVLLDPGFFSGRFDIAPRDRTRVFSFSARNRINGLTYGNGGVKIWPRAALTSLRTHENAQRGSAAVDFCWTVPYYQVNRQLSEVDVTGSSCQAFRAGFREGVKLNLANGALAYDAHPDLPRGEALERHIGSRNLERLCVWCTVGADIEQGDWAIFGARLGCAMTALEGFEFGKVSDYGWINSFWEKDILPRYGDTAARAAATLDLGHRLRRDLNLSIFDLDPEHSRNFRMRLRGFRAYGAMKVV